MIWRSQNSAKSELPFASQNFAWLPVRPSGVAVTTLEPPIPFEDLPARLPHILGPASGILCQIVDYS